MKLFGEIFTFKKMDQSKSIDTEFCLVDHFKPGAIKKVDMLNKYHLEDKMEIEEVS